MGAYRHFDYDAIAKDVLDGVPRQEIARAHGCSTALVASVIRMKGLAGKHSRSLNREYDESPGRAWCTAIQMWQDGKSDQEIADCLCVSRQRIGQMKNYAHSLRVSLARNNLSVLAETKQILAELLDVMELYTKQARLIKADCSFALIGADDSDEPAADQPVAAEE